MAEDAGSKSLVLQILEEWQDIEHTPLELNEVIMIDYTEEFRIIFGILRVARLREERSERCLRLAGATISLNASDNTAWTFRRESAHALASSSASNFTRIWRAELTFAGNKTALSPKNYQAWEHRRHAATQLGNIQAELEFADLHLEKDQKNYHAWSHRQWIVVTHGITQGELEASQWFIEVDVRNNSAWNHRWLVVRQMEGKCREDEVNWTLSMLDKSPKNESAWNYLSAIASTGVDVDLARKAAEMYIQTDRCNVPARRFLVLNSGKKYAQKAVDHCKVLQEVDPVREKYWKLKTEGFEILMAGSGTETKTDENCAT